MKKSEMVNILFEALQKWESCKIEKRTAKDILKVIEKAGMIPPLTKFKDPGHFLGDEFEYESCEWEDED